ncbi:MAG TPA: ImmA/IrrE family metallo-endopeptidase [Verrucomicrobiae bacterium]|nr:ImmA/IrrE family metallo-endopeptidase [Verrucomicrobiae bacterium]
MAREIQKIRAEGTAYRIIQDYCWDTPAPVPVEDIAMDRGILCLEAKLTGCLARLVRKGQRGIIRTDSKIREEGRKRFAIAHELGHWFLHEKESQFFVCTAEQMRDYKGSPVEVEANLFASELLLPTGLLRPLVTNCDPRLENIKALAGTFNTSLTATGMKFIDLNKHECILVLSKNKVVAWSKQQGSRFGLRIKKGVKLHPDSLAYHVIPPAGEAGPEVVNPEAWISQNSYARQIEVTEQSWALEGYNSALTLLVIADADGAEGRDMVSHYEFKNRRAD